MYRVDDMPTKYTFATSAVSFRNHVTNWLDIEYNLKKSVKWSAVIA